MSVETEWRLAAVQSAARGSAWSLLDYHAHHRMAKLFSEAEQERLARSVRRVGRTGPEGPPPAAGQRALQAALSALALLSRRLVIHRG